LDKVGYEFLDHIVTVTGDKTWVLDVNVGTEEQSKQWTHTHSPNKRKTFKQTWSACQKDEGNRFLGQEMSVGDGIHATIKSEGYCETLKYCVGTAIQKRRRGFISSGLVFLHDNARRHTAARTQALLEHFNWELFDQLRWNPDLAPSDSHLFTCLKNWLRTQLFNSNKKLMDGIKTWLNSYAAGFFDIDKLKIIPRYDKCLNSNSDYVHM
jgi:hypothetical protein